MAVLRRLMLVALCAGLLSGIFATAAHQIATVPVILKAETYEKAAEHATAEASVTYISGQGGARKTLRW